MRSQYMLINVYFSCDIYVTLLQIFYTYVLCILYDIKSHINIIYYSLCDFLIA